MDPPSPDRHLTWQERSRELLLHSPIFDLYRSERTAHDGGRSGQFYLLDARDWVTVVPVLRSGREGDAFLMVRQFRHGIERITLEFPAGLAEPGEAPAEAALRELAEETGHEAEAVAHVATMGAAPAFMNNWCHVYVAWGLERRRDQRLDENEKLEVVTVPVDEAIASIGSGELVNSITAMSLHFYLRWAARLSGAHLGGARPEPAKEGADRIRTGA